jgi:hypothetical protein
VDSFKIAIAGRNGDRRYRHGDVAEWDLAEAAELAVELLDRGVGTQYVTVGNGEHEFRLMGEDQGERHAEWFVDAQIGETRWRYRPMADLDDYPAADDLAEQAAALAPDVSRIWVGRSDGSEEFESETRED